MSRVVAGLIASSFYGIGAVFGVVCGLLVDRLGTRRMILAGGVTMALASLAGGFAYCQRERDGRRVRSAAELRPGERLRLRFADGAARCQVEEVESE